MTSLFLGVGIGVAICAIIAAIAAYWFLWFVCFGRRR